MPAPDSTHPHPAWDWSMMLHQLAVKIWTCVCMCVWVSESMFYNLHIMHCSSHLPFPLCSASFLAVTSFLHRMLNTPLSSLYTLLSNLTALSFSPSTVSIYLLLCRQCRVRSSICLPYPKDHDRSWHMILHIFFAPLSSTSHFVLSFIPLLSITLNPPPPCPWQFLLHHLAPLCLPPLSLALYVCVFQCVTFWKCLCVSFSECLLDCSCGRECVRLCELSASVSFVRLCLRLSSGLGVCKCLALMRMWAGSQWEDKGPDGIFTKLSI